jgi:tripartite ATP-independent transporter DctP family solute receptor
MENFIGKLRVIMKYLIGTSILFITITLYILFNPFDQKNQLSYDDEQEGITQQIVIQFSHVVAENTPKGLAAQKFAQLISEKTDGLVKVEIFPNGTLFTDEEELDALRDNKVQMIAPSVSKMTKLAPEWGYYDLPFLFHDYEEIKTALSSDIGKKLLSLHEREGIHGLALWSNGFKQMTSNIRPLHSPKDFSGQRFRIMPSFILEEQFNQLKAVPVVVPFDQIYTSLKEDQFDGQENTISNIYSRRLYGLQNYMTISDHGFLGYAVLMNKEFWDGLPKNVQTSLQEAMEETTEWMVAESEKMNKAQLEKIKEESSINVYELSAEERAQWLKVLQPVYQTFLHSIKKDFMKEYMKKKIEEIETL